MDTVFCPKDNTILTNSTSQDNPPSILDYLNNVQIVGENSTEYICICPICGKKKFKIRKDNGKYQCWSNSCSPKEIYKAIVALEKQGIRRSDRPSTRKSDKPKIVPAQESAAEQIDIAKVITKCVLPKIVGKEAGRSKGNRTITYLYSDTQYMERIEKPDAKKPKGYRKDYFSYHSVQPGEWQSGDGPGIWLLYREVEAIAQAKGKTILIVEGEPCVECLWYLGFIAVSPKGSDWTEGKLLAAMIRLKDAGIARVINLVDNDVPGEKKAAKLAAACLEAGLPYHRPDLKDIYPDLPEEGDILDVYEKLVENGMGKDELVGKLEQLFQRAPAFVFEELIETDPTELLRRDLLELSKSTDPVKKILLTRDIKKIHNLTNAEINSALKELKARPEENKPNLLRLDTLFKEAEKGIQYIIPGLLPENETILFVADPKVGKSLATYDAAYAITTGNETFLGEKCKQGRVLIIQTDESMNTAGFRLHKRGFRLTDIDNIAVLDHFNINQIDVIDEILSRNSFDVVIVDCLRKIVSGKEIPENSPEFADIIYQLRDLFSKHEAAGILIHHLNKNPNSSGVDRVRGSSGIAGAVWGIWFLEHILKPDPRNRGKRIVDPNETCRIFSIIARDVQGQRLKIELDLENNHWINHGSDQVSEQETDENKTTEQRVVDLLKSIAPEALPAKEIQSRLGIESNVYSPLKRLYDAKSIYKKDAPGGNGRVLYFIPKGDEQLELPETLPSLPNLEPSQTRSQGVITSLLTEESVVMDEVKPVEIELDKDEAVIYPSCDVVIQLPEVSSGTGFAPHHKDDHHSITSISQEDLVILPPKLKEPITIPEASVPDSINPEIAPKFKAGDQVALDGDISTCLFVDNSRFDTTQNCFMYEIKPFPGEYQEDRLMDFEQARSRIELDF